MKSNVKGMPRFLGDVNDKLVNPPTPGTYFFRACLQNTTTTTSNWEMQISTQGAAASPTPNTLQRGPHAVLGPNSLVCGDPNTTSRANRVGQSSVPVLWRPTNSAQVNDFVQPGPGAFLIVMCGMNTSSQTA
jgi:hypothetical protein